MVMDFFVCTNLDNRMVQMAELPPLKSYFRQFDGKILENGYNGYHGTHGIYVSKQLNCFRAAI